RVRQAAIVYADNIMWLGKKQIKLLVMNKKDESENIQFNKIVIKAAKKNAVVRMLGI
ncbi:14681_t:CDS:2, partial [Gigaspora margarita]